MLIVNGRVESIGTKLDVPKGCPTLDASGLLIMPGGVDIATYIQNDLFGFDAVTYENTTKEALLGGTTTIIDTVICPKGRLPFDVFVETRRRVSSVRVWCNVVYRIGIVEITLPTLEQMECLVKQNEINSFLFFVSTTKDAEKSAGITVEQLRTALEKCRQWGVVAFVRIGNHSIDAEGPVNGARGEPTEAESQILEKILVVAEDTNCPIVLTSPQRTSIILSAFRARHQIPPVHVHVSCTPSTLLPTTEDGQQIPSQFLNHLSVGDIVAVSSDQFGGKQSGESRRLGAIGQRMVAVWEAAVPTGWLDACSFVSVISGNAARVAGLYPVKGRINPGSDADLVFWPIGSLQHSGSGRPIAVLLRGKLLAREGQLANQTPSNNPQITIDRQPITDEEPRPQGIYLKVKPFPAAVYGPVQATDRLRRRHQYVKNQSPWAMGALNDELRVTGSTTPNRSKDHELPASPTDTVTSPAPTTDQPGRAQTTANSTPSMRMVHGHRDLHASGFSLSGAQVDDNQPQRPGIRTSQPPGGVSRNPLW
ncbi:Dihydropyrimidinase protein 5 [Fasciola gigantica]|uniref:Dihydropyrimidinase protein 5 n=1 Tax=Fasciola gigantica TaxID=46835 RepID=A0A504Z7G7_FASGI|nr:Dihydropyrimidinase protein 5 [Fasciola gigantica]